jgi:putative hydrolase of the HAD superfamily
MSAPPVISLDLDDTLWPVAPVLAAAEAALLAWLAQRHPRAAEGHDIESMRRLRADIAARFPESSHDMTFLRQRALMEQFVAAGYAEQREGGPAAAEAMEVFLLERNRVCFYPDALPALERLHAGHRLFAVSNGNADLALCGIARLFEGHVTAANAGAAKPDARIYAELLRISGMPPHAIMHIGDDPLADVVGARRAGIEAVWLNRDQRPWPAELGTAPRTISSLAEIF